MPFLNLSLPNMTLRRALAVLLITDVSLSIAGAQDNATKSSCALSPVQITEAGISATLATNVENACNFERSVWANGSVTFDDFYHVPSYTSNAPAGTLLKVQQDANTSAYTLPPNTALSRIMFLSKNFNGSTVPASAYVLWPFAPRIRPDGYPIVAWAHGTSGLFSECAPSHYKTLSYEFAAPYELALQGYVVVAPDYAGLGVYEDTFAKPVVHQYAAGRAQANDIFYSVQAAQSAFKELSKHFFVIGHSQGGPVAWAAAERQAIEPVDGYLGAVAGSPVTRWLDLAAPGGIASTVVGTFLFRGMASIFPQLKENDIFTTNGVKRYALISEIQGCNGVASELFFDVNIVQANWTQNRYVQAFQDLTANGGRRISGPLLVIQGGSDPTVPPQTTTKAVNKTCDSFPDTQLQYVTYTGVTHVPVMFASQRLWLEWIAERFAGAHAEKSCHSSVVSSARPYKSYQQNFNWIIAPVTQPYQLA